MQAIKEKRELCPFVFQLPTSNQTREEGNGKTLLKAQHKAVASEQYITTLNFKPLEYAQETYSLHL